MKFFSSHRVIKLSMILLFGLTVPTNGNIIEIENLSDVAAHLESKGSEKTVCGFDIDFTLTRPTDPATDPANFQKHAKIFMQMLKENKLIPQDVICATALTEQQLMEFDISDTVDAINTIATVVGLTARYSGQFAGVNFEDHTLTMLKQFGIMFNGSTEYRTIFEELPDHRGNKPVFNNGVIFCNGERGAPVTKPEVFAEYLKSNGIHTQKVVIVDDTKKHLEDFETFFAEKMSGIEFIGLYYTKALHEAPRDCTEDEFKAYMQRLVTILQSESNKQ